MQVKLFQLLKMLPDPVVEIIFPFSFIAEHEIFYCTLLLCDLILSLCSVSQEQKVS